MATYQEYFDKKTYKPKYLIGDRVEGKYKGIPFVGTVANDYLVSEDEGPKVAVSLDLPLIHNNVIHTLLFLKVKDIKKRFCIYT